MAMDTPHREPTTSKKVGNRLKEVRESQRLSIIEVSTLLKVSISVIQEIEDGHIDKYFSEIYGLLCFYSQSAHSIFAEYFNSNLKTDIEAGTDIGDCIDYVLDSIRFHKAIQNRTINLASFPLARGKSQGKYTNLTGVSDIYKRKSLRKTASSILEKRAKDTIEKHKLYKLPINVYQVAINLGIKISFESFPSELYMKLRGFCYKEEHFSLIGVNKNHPIALQRFTVAHELHHYLYDFNSTRFLCGPENSNAVFELNAERFAAEILMPRASLKRLSSNHDNIRYLTVHLVAEHFGVSYDAAAIRLYNLGLAPDPKKVCARAYRKKDKQKTQYLIQEKLDYLIAVFGLETGIEQLQLDAKVRRHYLCGSIITDPNHTVCWRCGMELKEPSSNSFLLKNPYRQSPANISPIEIISFEEKKQMYKQLSFNLNS